MEGAHVSKSEKSSEWNMYSKTLQGAEVMQIKANAHVTRRPELHNSAGYRVSTDGLRGRARGKIVLKAWRVHRRLTYSLD